MEHIKYDSSEFRRWIFKVFIWKEHKYVNIFYVDHMIKL